MQIKFITIASAFLLCTQAIPLDTNVQGTQTTEGKCHTGGKYFIPEFLVESELAADTCVQHGGVLADITSVNFIEVISLMIQCKGSFSRGWIKTWESTDYGSKCLAVYAGQSVPGGGVDINCMGDMIAPVCIGPQVLTIADKQIDPNNSVANNTALVDPIPPIDNNDDAMLVSGSFMEKEQKKVANHSIEPTESDKASTSNSPAPSVSVLHPRKSKKQQK